MFGLLSWGQARAHDPKAPLVPELQVVLSHLLDQAAVDATGTRVVSVPDDSTELDRQISDALDGHLRRALTADVFDIGRGRAAARDARTAALLVLAELVDAEGRRGEGRTREELIRGFGEHGKDILETLASPRIRLVVQDRRQRDDAMVYVLAHDRLAEVVTRMLNAEGSRLADLNPALVALRRFVAQRTDLYLRLKDRTALALTRAQQSLIGTHQALLFDDDRRQWWEACREHRRRQQRRQVAWSVAASAVLAVAGLVGWSALEDARNTEVCGAAAFGSAVWCLPADAELGFVEVPAGPFWMGSDAVDSEANADEFPQHEVELDRYYIGKYEVTDGQFAVFVDETAHEGWPGPTWVASGINSSHRERPREQG